MANFFHAYVAVELMKCQKSDNLEYWNRSVSDFHKLSSIQMLDASLYYLPYQSFNGGGAYTVSTIPAQTPYVYEELSS